MASRVPGNMMVKDGYRVTIGESSPEDRLEAKTEAYDLGVEMVEQG